ncbi:MAG: hypothetical protein CL917_12195 [Deltaproteobacteria bacterium]|nr:hypothetical protein [Deltaproteobacteria bacterium]
MKRWLTPEEARSRTGLRLVLTVSVPGPWSEAAKALFHVKKIPHDRVIQEGGSENEALFDWTGERNAPQAVFNQETTRSGWRDIIELAERLEPHPALCPKNAEAREEMFDWIALLADENGLGWQRRLMLLQPMMALPETHPGHQMVANLAQRYGYDSTKAQEASRPIIQILKKFSLLFQKQREAGHRYLLGESLSALDLYWAAFAAIIDPLPPSICPMPDVIRAGYLCEDPDIRSALDPRLLEHRTALYQEWLEIPLDLGP